MECGPVGCTGVCCSVRYHDATVAVRVLRLIAVASIFALALSVRAGATHASTDEAIGEPPPAVVDLPPVGLDGQPLIDAPALAELPPVSMDPSAAASVGLILIEPAPVDPSPVDPVTTDPSPSEPTPTNPPLQEPPPVDLPPVDVRVAEPLPISSDVPVQTTPAVPIASPLPEPAPTTGEGAAADSSEGELIVPSAIPSSPEVVAPLAQDAVDMPTAGPPATRGATVGEAVGPQGEAPAAAPFVPGPDAASAPLPATIPQGPPPALAGPADSAEQIVADGARHVIDIVLLEGMDPMSAGLLAGVAVTNRPPAAGVAVAIEFGRAGGGWAGAIVFNLWLRRRLRERRMSQRQLAALSGVDHSTISRLLLADRRPSLATATKLAEALGHVRGESEAADYFERVPEDTLFPARRVEMALRADESLSEEEVLRLMRIYLETRRMRHAASSHGDSLNDSAPSVSSASSVTNASKGDRRRT